MKKLDQEDILNLSEAAEQIRDYFDYIKESREPEDIQNYCYFGLREINYIIEELKNDK